MGYRRLLLRYLQHADQLLGTPLVELASASEIFTKRDIGELKTLWAEIDRKRLREDQPHTESPDLGGLLATAIRTYGLSNQQAAQIAGVSPARINQWCASQSNNAPQTDKLQQDEFTRILFALISWYRQQPRVAATKMKLQ